MDIEITEINEITRTTTLDDTSVIPVQIPNLSGYLTRSITWANIKTLLSAAFGVKRSTGAPGQFVNGVDSGGNLTYNTPAGAGAGRNLLMNGEMRIHQRASSVSGITTSGYYVQDRWKINLQSLGEWELSHEADTPPGYAFSSSAKFRCTASASPTALTACYIQQSLEGQHCQTIMKGNASAKSIVVSFWIKTKPGTYIVELYDIDKYRSCSKSFTIASEAWIKKTITFPPDTNGTLDNDAEASLSLNIWLGAGSNYNSGTLQTTWASVISSKRAAGVSNLGAAINNYIFLTGVQMETNIETDYEHIPYDIELQRCKRYFYNLASGAAKIFGQGYYVSNTQVECNQHHPVEMRSAPTLQITSGTNYYQARRTGATNKFNSLQAETTATRYFLYNDTVSGTSGYGARMETNNENSSISFSADL